MNVLHKKAGKLVRVLGIGASAGLMSLTPLARAMAAGEGTEAAPALEEIVVSAQRRQENSQTVPITVDTVSGDDALRRGTTSIQTLAATIPNLTFTTASFATNTYIRGIGDNSASPNNEPSAAVYMDGVYNPASMALTSFSFNNIQQIEVLKGPQGTLFGRNSTAGVIQIITPDPKHELGGKFDVGYGNFNTITSDGYITGGLTDSIAADLAVQYLNQMDGYGHSLVTGTPTFRQRNLGLRSKWLFDISGATKIRATVDYSEFNSDGTSNQYSPYSFPPFAGNWNNTSNVPTSNRTKQYGASVHIDQDFGDILHGASISSYRHVKGTQWIDSDISPINGNTIYEAYEANYWTQEFQLSNQNPGRITWVAGLFYYGNQVFGSDPRIQTGTQIKTGYTAIHGVQNTMSASAFAQATADVGWDTKFTTGLRYTSERLRENGYTADVNNLPTSTLTNSEITSHPVTWRFALDHTFMDGLLGYISYNRGFKSGGYNLSSPAAAPFLPEHVEAYEVGLKTEFLDHRIRMNAAAFYYDYTDLQVAIVLGGNQLFTNAAAARNFGLDYNVDFAATDNLTLSAGLGLLNAKYKNYPGARGYTPLGVAVNIPNAKGADLPFAPPVTGFVSADYKQETPIGQFRETANLSYNDRSYVTPDMGLVRPTYWTLNASTEWRPGADSTLAVRLWGRNLTNSISYLFASESSTGWYYAPAPPRTYGVTVEKSF